jgi:tRNA(Ile)-lysidine synthase
MEEACNKQATVHIAQLANDMRAADAYLSEQAKKLLLESSKKAEQSGIGIRERIYGRLSGGGARLDCDLLTGQPDVLAPYLIRACILQMGGSLKDLSRQHIQAICELACGNGEKRLSLPDGLFVRREYGRLLFEREENDREIPAFGVAFSVFLYNKNKKVPQNCCVNWFDYDRINAGIRLRVRRPGDRICVAAGGKSKKLKDYLIDAKMPACVRDRWPVLAMDDRILWVPGYRMDEDCKVTAETRLVLQAVILEAF